MRYWVRSTEASPVYSRTPIWTLVFGPGGAVNHAKQWVPIVRLSARSLTASTVSPGMTP